LSLFGPDELFNAFSNFLAPFQSSEWAKDSIPYKLFTAFMGSLNSIYMTMTVATFLSHSQILEALLTNFNEKFNRKCSRALLNHFLYILIAIHIEIRETMRWSALGYFIYFDWNLIRNPFKNAVGLSWSIFFLCQEKTEICRLSECRRAASESLKKLSFFATLTQF